VGFYGPLDTVILQPKQIALAPLICVGRPSSMQTIARAYNTGNAGMEMSPGREGEKTKDAARSSSITEENLLNIYWAKTR
jgi:hypothetical protein